MENKTWRIVWTHISGYKAPHQVMDAEKHLKEEALMKKASEVSKQSRLSDFPEVWKWKLELEPELSKRGWRKRKKAVSE
jgi:hypothetical protein